nr:response regulator transcription factor [Limobrevibacterium gyesilva]
MSIVGGPSTSESQAVAGGPLSPRVLVIEDHPDVARVMLNMLARSGMQTAWASCGAQAMQLKRSFNPQVALVDLELPDTSGIVLIQWLASEGDCGIIVVSGLSDEADRVVSLEVGADDYIAKPPKPRELVARIRAVHRRIDERTRRPAAASRPASLLIGDARVDLDGRLALDASGRHIDITAAEFAALDLLVAARGAPVSREHLSEGALRRAWQAEDRSVDQLIFGLRRKLAGDEAGRRLIRTIRGTGYSLHLSGNR